ncbi:MAG: DUF2085 domain-containing protein [Anaerolineae bacterium]|nr:DUF2085 domain-containing protein [Anaerolineae bacterium]
MDDTHVESARTPAVVNENLVTPAAFPRGWTWLGVGLLISVLGAFIILTPPGVLRKVDFIAAAVCHRIASHSFFIHGHQLPLCQRCTGTFTAALTGLIFQWGILKRRNTRDFPPLSILILTVVLVIPWGLDGFNSYTTFFTGGPAGIFGYVPQPWIRLLTGTLVGMGMSVVLVPAFNQVAWSDGTSDRTLRDWKEWSIFLLVELVQAALIYTRWDWLLYPLTIYSGLAIIAMFALLGTMVFVMALGRDNCCTRWRDLWVPLVWGVLFAMFLIGGVNLLRLNSVGTIDGVPGLSHSIFPHT